MAWSAARCIGLIDCGTARERRRATSKFDNRKKIDFFQNDNRFLEKNEINIPTINVSVRQKIAVVFELIVYLHQCVCLFSPLRTAEVMYMYLFLFLSCVYI